MIIILKTYQRKGTIWYLQVVFTTDETIMRVFVILCDVCSLYEINLSVEQEENRKIRAEELTSFLHDLISSYYFLWSGLAQSCLHSGTSKFFLKLYAINTEILHRILDIEMSVSFSLRWGKLLKYFLFF